jgi:hypothetical protein
MTLAYFGSIYYFRNWLFCQESMAQKEDRWTHGENGNDIGVGVTEGWGDAWPSGGLGCWAGSGWGGGIGTEKSGDGKGYQAEELGIVTFEVLPTKGF